MKRFAFCLIVTLVFTLMASDGVASVMAKEKKAAVEYGLPALDNFEGTVNNSVDLNSFGSMTLVSDPLVIRFPKAQTLRLTPEALEVAMPPGRRRCRGPTI